ncbi:hypothetical protein ACJJH9_05280 [Microbulbifer sp. DLAB2-AF]|uniref:hypothetical protein n=1 Tax=Microbulbifer sp. DLAB2-AF TaxID=3243395 RepID=UPI0040396602
MDLLVFTGSRRHCRRRHFPVPLSSYVAIVPPELFKHRQKILAQMRGSAGIYWLAPALPAAALPCAAFILCSDSSS